MLEDYVLLKCVFAGVYVHWRDGIDQRSFYTERFPLEVPLFDLVTATSWEYHGQIYSWVCLKYETKHVMLNQLVLIVPKIAMP